MRILIAPTAFKGTFSPAEVAKAMSDGVDEFARLVGKRIYIDVLPVADGGDGTVEAIAIATNCSPNRLEVSGSLGEARTAQWLDLGNFAVVELASACGIASLDPANLRPLEANSLALGTVLKHVLETTSIPNIVVAVGGSASTDGGSAALYELGARFFDANDKQFLPAGGGSLTQMARCDLSAARLRLRGRNVIVATDVQNPLLGEDGAAYVFGAQKGASPDEIALLDKALFYFAELVEADIGVRLRDLKGAGAAGGAAFGMAALGATITPGFSWLANLLRLPDNVSRADLVITGEGRTDASSLKGKAIGSLNDLCLKYAKPLWIFSGYAEASLDESALRYALITGVASPPRRADLNQIKKAVFDTLCARFDAFQY